MFVSKNDKGDIFLRRFRSSSPFFALRSSASSVFFWVPRPWDMLFPAAKSEPKSVAIDFKLRHKQITIVQKHKILATNLCIIICRNKQTCSISVQEMLKLKYLNMLEAFHSSRSRFKAFKIRTTSLRFSVPPSNSDNDIYTNFVFLRRQSWPLLPSQAAGWFVAGRFRPEASLASHSASEMSVDCSPTT